MKNRKFSATAVILAMILSFYTPITLAEGNENITYWDFEENGVSYSEYFNRTGITMKTTNYSVESSRIDYIEGSNMLHIKGYNSKAINLNADATFTFPIDEYSASKYPDSKLVISYDIVYLSFTRPYNPCSVLVSGKNENALQMFCFSDKNGVRQTPGNNGNYSITAGLSKRTSNHLIFDLENGKIDFVSGTAEKRSIPTSCTSIDKIAFNVGKDEEIALDNISVNIVKNGFSIISAPKFTDGNNISFTANSPVLNPNVEVINEKGKSLKTTVSVSSDTVNVYSPEFVKGGKYSVEIESDSTNIALTRLSRKNTYSCTNPYESVPESDILLESTDFTDGFSPFDALHFTFSRPIKSMDIQIKADGKHFDNFDYDFSGENAKIEFKNAEVIPCDTETQVKINLTDTDNKIKSFTLKSVSGSADSFFDIYRQSLNLAQAGMGGFSVLVKYDSASPVKVYFDRLTQAPEKEDDLPFTAPCYAKVIDPDGETLGVLDMTKNQSGKSAYTFEFPNGKSGIWQFQFSDARNYDLIGIAVKDADCWGERGECFLGKTQHTLSHGYIYVPKKVDSLIVGTTTVKTGFNSPFSVTSPDGAKKTSVSSDYTFAKQTAELNNIGDEGVFELNLDENMYGFYCVDRAPSLICPTEEMALELKGAWIDVEGVLCQGVIQANARKTALKLVREKDLEVRFNKPALPDKIDYPMAEATLFGAYGLITPLGDQVERQITDPESPYLGMFIQQGTVLSDEWEKGNFVNTGTTESFGTVVGLPAQLNYFYQNQALAYRTALHILGSIIMSSEDNYIREGDNALNYPTTHGNFYYHWVTQGYQGVRELLDADIRKAIDDGLTAMTDKQGAFRGMNTTNQWFFTVAGVETVAVTIGEQRHHELFKNHIRSLYKNDIYNGRLGQATSGYFVENTGCDGEYHNLCQLLLYVTCRDYEKWQNRDDEIVSEIDEIIEKNLDFNSHFWLPQPTTEQFATANCFTSRTDGGFGITTHTNYELLVDKYPLAKRRKEISNPPITNLGAASTFPCVVSDDDWAINLIKQSYPKYENGVKNYKSHGSFVLYDAMKNIGKCVSEPLPCERIKDMWAKNGIIAFKHKGLYFNIFYAFEDVDVLPEKSFMGGGPTLVWSQGTGTVLASNKAENYNSVTSQSQLNASCIYGTDKSGRFFSSGKEIAKLNWIKEDKCFEISGNLPNRDIKVSYKYELTDDGVDLTAECTGGEVADAWLNLPFAKSEVAANVSLSSNVLTYSYGDSNITVTTENECTLSDSGMLQIKLGTDGTAKVSFKANEEKAIRFIDAKETSGLMKMKIKSLINAKPVRAVIATYDKNNRLLNVRSKQVTLYKKNDTLFYINNSCPNRAYSKLFILDGFDTLYPYDLKEYRYQ